jgi:hypothetical protein
MGTFLSELVIRRFADSICSGNIWLFPAEKANVGSPTGSVPFPRQAIKDNLRQLHTVTDIQYMLNCIVFNFEYS